MELDLVLVSLPAFTQKAPSLGLASLAAYLQEKDYNFLCYDYGPQFHNTHLKKFKLTSTLLEDLHLSPYPLWGASNWLGFEEIIQPKFGYYLLESLCPVCSKLYQPIFEEFQVQHSLSLQILDQYAEKLTSHDSMAYAFSLLTGNSVASLYVIKRIKEMRPETTIIVGGPEASPYYRATFYSSSDLIDYTVYSPEGEVPLTKILSHLKNEIPKQSIPGIYWKTDEYIQKTAPPPLFDLNQLPIPDFGLVETGYKLHQLNSLDLFTSKGCPHQCVFCNESLIWGSFRPKSRRRIYQEIRHYVETYGMDHFELADNSFLSSPSLAPALDELYTSGVIISWSGNARPDELTEQNLSTFSKYGLSHCYIGLESASPKIQTLMGKKIDPGHANSILKACQQNSIKASLYLMLGFPGETSEEFQKTIDFVIHKKAYIENILVSVFNLMPDTPIFSTNLLTPIPLGPKILNAYTYQTSDGVTHADRRQRFLQLHALKAR
jgi:radical SAM superfamily enzyme YgiQ (UPF0313 family)